MILLPAIDLYEGKAVRLYQGDYNQITVYSSNPPSLAQSIESQGAEWLHVVDLAGARDGGTPNLDTILAILNQTNLHVEVGGGIRSMDVIDTYLSHGVARVILGTAAVENEDFLKQALNAYGDKIAVGVDAKNGLVATHGWKMVSEVHLFDFLHHLQSLGVKTVICTDISKDGAMKGTNLALYQKIHETVDINLIASGGISSLDDLAALNHQHLYGAILGKAMYTKAIRIKDALALLKEQPL